MPEKLKQIVCEACKRPFGGTGPRPHTLACGKHSLCLSCLKKGHKRAVIKLGSGKGTSTPQEKNSQKNGKFGKDFYQKKRGEILCPAGCAGGKIFIKESKNIKDHNPNRRLEEAIELISKYTLQMAPFQPPEELDFAFCETHPGELLTLFCKTCKKLIC